MERVKPDSGRGTLRGKLEAQRRQHVVGRREEKALFLRVLRSTVPFALLHVWGPGGIGKSTLLSEFVELCRAEGRPYILLDAYDLEPTPQGFLAALGSTPRKPIGLTEKTVLFIDTCERLSALEPWLREHFLPQLPEGVRIVMAGRERLSAVWRSDPGWRGLMHTLPLRNLTPEESRLLLERCDVPRAQHDAVLAFTHGHPLALALVVEVLEQTAATTFQAEAMSDVVAALLGRFIREVPSAEHQQALEIGAHARVTTEALLRYVLETDAHEAFDWLCGLSFIYRSAEGIYPHDIVRDVLGRDHRWRDPDGFLAMHLKVRRYFYDRLEHTQDREQQRAMLELFYLNTYTDAERRYHDPQGFGSVYAEPLAAAAAEDVVAMTVACEGVVSGELARYWLERQPGAFYLMRRASGDVEGVFAQLMFSEFTEQDRSSDPAIGAVATFLAHEAPLRSGERVSYIRFWLDREHYQKVSATQGAIFAASTVHYLTQKGLAWSFVVCAEPTFWDPLFARIDWVLVPAAAFSVSERPYSVFAHDWRQVPKRLWLERIEGRRFQELPEGEEPTESPILVLSQPDFAAAVKGALRTFHDAKTLQANPLLRSRVVLDEAGEAEAVLRALLLQAAEGLRTGARGEKPYRALRATYLEPAATQELAAERLGLPFSTYYRHLTRGVLQVTAWLWERELSRSG